MTEKKFQRTIEDFICGHCGAKVHGNGYTNHCPNCLWSKHADINPGDRQAHCGGLMRPIMVEQKSGEFVITHQCEVCGHLKRNKVAPGDNVEALAKI